MQSLTSRIGAGLEDGHYRPAYSVRGELHGFLRQESLDGSPCGGAGKYLEASYLEYLHSASRTKKLIERK